MKPDKGYPHQPGSSNFEGGAAYEAYCDEVEKRAVQPDHRARPLSEWHEDMGPMLWWRFPIEEPPYVGTPLDLGRTVLLQIIGADDPMLRTSFDVGGWPGYHTHWTPIPRPVGHDEAGK